jgi:hypothetical protein
MSKNISLDEAQSFLQHQSLTSYSSIHLLEIHRRLFEVTKLVMQLNYSSSYGNTLMVIEKIINQLKAEQESTGCSFENIPLTPRERNLIDEFSVSIAKSETKQQINQVNETRFDDFDY